MFLDLSSPILDPEEIIGISWHSPILDYVWGISFILCVVFLILFFKAYAQKKTGQLRRKWMPYFYLFCLFIFLCLHIFSVLFKFPLKRGGGAIKNINTNWEQPE